jgi:protein subunit release factor A
MEEEKRTSQLGSARSSVGRAMRSDKIRTYNFSRNQIKDHRIDKSFNLDKIMAGDLTDMLLELTVLDNPPESSTP